jgi:hypothetical protein
MRLYVGGLPYQTTEKDLLDLFEQGGNVASATVITDRDTGRNGTSIGDRTIIVNEAHERQSTGRERRPSNSYRSERY